MQTTSLMTHQEPPEPLISHLIELVGDPAAHGAQPWEANARLPPRDPGKPGEAAAPRNPGPLPAAPHRGPPSFSRQRPRCRSLVRSQGQPSPAGHCWGPAARARPVWGQWRDPRHEEEVRGARKQRPRAVAEFPLIRSPPARFWKFDSLAREAAQLFSVLALEALAAEGRPRSPSALWDKVPLGGR